MFSKFLDFIFLDFGIMGSVWGVCSTPSIEFLQQDIFCKSSDMRKKPWKTVAEHIVRKRVGVSMAYF